jgi:hypothetical protein
MPNVQDLLNAINAGDKERVAVVLKIVHPDAEFIDGQNVLNLSMHGENSDPEITRMLLAAGADPNKLNEYGQSPFQYAISASAFTCALVLLDFGADFHATQDAYQAPLDRLLGEIQSLQSDLASQATQIAFIQELGGLPSAQLHPNLLPCEQANKSLTITGLFDMAINDLRNYACNGKRKALQDSLARLDPATASQHATTIINLSGHEMPLACLEILLKAGADPNATSSYNRDRSTAIENAALRIPIDQSRLNLYIQHAGNINLRNAVSGLTILDRRKQHLLKSEQEAALFFEFIEELKRRGITTDQSPPTPAQPAPMDLTGIESWRGLYHFDNPWLCPTLILAHASPSDLRDTLEKANALESHGSWTFDNPLALAPLSMLLLRLKGHQWSFILVPGYAPTKSQARELSKIASIKTLFIEHESISEADSAFLFEHGKTLEQVVVTSEGGSCKSSIRKIKITSATSPHDYFDALLKFLDAMATHAMLEKSDDGQLKLFGPFTPQTVDQAIWITPAEGILEPQ